MQMNIDRPDTLYGTGSILAFTSGSDVATKDAVRKPHHLTEFILCMAMQGFPPIKICNQISSLDFESLNWIDNWCFDPFYRADHGQ